MSVKASSVTHLDGELQTAVVHVVVVAHAALYHLHLLVPVVTDGKRLRMTRALAENLKLSLSFWGTPIIFVPKRLFGIFGF